MPRGIYKHKPHTEETKKKIKIARLERKKRLGYINSPETRKKIKEKHQKGDKCWNWKGNNVSYSMLHCWVNRWKGKPKKCQFCGKVYDKPKSIQWANKSGKYLRNLNDWIPLCYKCHRKYDKKVR